MSQEGVEHLTTNRIAERAGVSIGTIYQYFADKKELVDEVRRRSSETFRERLLEDFGRSASLPLPVAIPSMIRTLVALHAEDPGLHNALAAPLAAVERVLFIQVMTSYLAGHRASVRRPNLRLAAEISLDVAESLIHGAALREPARLEDEEFIAEVSDVLVRYLVASSAAETPQGPNIMPMNGPK